MADSRLWPHTAEAPRAWTIFSSGHSSVWLLWPAGVLQGLWDAWRMRDVEGAYSVFFKAFGTHGAWRMAGSRGC